MSESVLRGIKDMYNLLTDDEKRELIRFAYRERWQAGDKPRNILGYDKGTSNFDIDIIDGAISEAWLHDLLTGSKIEVKCDNEVSTTGNVAIEFECYGKPSGIAITEADYWAIVLDGSQYGHEVVVIIKTNRLRMLAETCPIKSGGDGNAARIYLVPVGELTLKRVDIFTRRANQGLKNNYK